MSTSIRSVTLLVATTLLTLSAQRYSFAGSATWSANPVSKDWNTPANWTPDTVPNGPLDHAHFNTSASPRLSIVGLIEVASLNFDSQAEAFKVYTAPSSTLGTVLFLTGAGIINTSGRLQAFVTELNETFTSGVFFENAATAGEMTSFAGLGGVLFFFDSSSAGSATFDLSSSEGFQAILNFSDNATAENAVVTASNFSDVGVFDFASGGSADFTLATGAFLTFGDVATADQAMATCIGGSGSSESSIHLHQFATAAEGHFTAVGGTTLGEAGGFIHVGNNATGADATFVVEGGAAAGLSGALLTFDSASSAGNASITATGGAGRAEGGAVTFEGNATGGTASLSLFGNGELDISATHLSGVTIGSLAGDGLVFLGSRTLTIGSNNHSTTFSGLIQESGAMVKLGTGTLTLGGANLYSGGTTISAGALIARNRSGSATGSGAVNLSSGTLGGRGTIAGPVEIGTGSGPGAFLAPAFGAAKPVTLRLQSGLTLQADAFCNWTLRAKQNRAETDLVIANGVTINGASLNLSGQTQGRLRRGLVLTLLSNTSANPINGTFSNLPEGAIVTVNGNNLQASYTGGDGNNLTLTVVP